MSQKIIYERRAHERPYYRDIERHDALIGFIAGFGLCLVICLGWMQI